MTTALAPESVYCIQFVKSDTLNLHVTFLQQKKKRLPNGRVFQHMGANGISSNNSPIMNPSLVIFLFFFLFSFIKT
jgi:hypothetical protein